MAKVQGILPVYDPLTKRILGAYNLPAAKNFEGNETTHCTAFPATPSATNTVPVQKITPPTHIQNQQERFNDWFMAAVFTAQQVKDKAYEGFPNFARIEDMQPDARWRGPESNPGQLNYYNGPLLTGLLEGFGTGAPNELAPRYTVAPTQGGSNVVGGTATSTAGTWVEDGSTVVTRQWLLNDVAIGGATNATVTVPNNVGSTLKLRITHTFGVYVTTFVTAGVTIVAA